MSYAMYVGAGGGIGRRVGNRRGDRRYARDCVGGARRGFPGRDENLRSVAVRRIPLALRRTTNPATTARISTAASPMTSRRLPVITTTAGGGSMTSAVLRAR